MISFVHQMRRQKDRFWKTCALLSCYMAMGLIGGIVGPTLLDLRQQIACSITSISFTLTARAAGHALGSIIMGLVYDRVNMQLATAVSMAYAAILFMSIPHITSTPVLMAVFFLNQLAFGAYETSSNIFMMHLWGREATSFLQTLHFMFGVGSLLAPVLAAPFLVEFPDEEAVLALDSNTTSTSNSTVDVFHPEDLQLVWPYSGIALFILFNSFVFFLIWRISPHTPVHESRVKPSTNTVKEEDKQVENEVTQKTPENKTKWKVMLVVLALLFMLMFHGLEITFGNFLTAFAVESDLKLGKVDGAHLTTMYWTTFTLFRIFTVFYIKFVGQELNIAGSVVVILLSNVILFPFGDKSPLLLWIGVAMVGIGTSSVWACVFGYMDEHLVVTSIISSSMIVSAVFGEFVFPVLISSFIESSPRVLLWVTLFSSLGTAVVFALMVLICRKKIGKRSH